MSKFQSWFSVEIGNIFSVETLKDFLRDEGIRFESSGCFNLVHFEIFVPNEKVYNLINDFLMFLPE